MQYFQKFSPRDALRQQENQRVQDAARLLDVFPELRMLVIQLAYFDAEGFTLPGNIKYTVNLRNAKTLFLLSCPNSQCVGGHFDLSAALDQLLKARGLSATGVAICQGWSSQATIDKVICRHQLRYRINLEYQAPGLPSRNLLLPQGMGSLPH